MGLGLYRGWVYTVDEVWSTLCTPGLALHCRRGLVYTGAWSTLKMGLGLHQGLVYTRTCSRLPQQLHELHALLSLLFWAYSACVLFALLF